MKQKGPAMTKSHMMPDKVHLVGSIGLDTAEEVFRTVGKVLGRRIRRVPDGEPGGRRMWISWQYPLLRASPFLKVDREIRLTQPTYWRPPRVTAPIAQDRRRVGEPLLG
jgi:hypothetical protein